MAVSQLTAGKAQYGTIEMDSHADTCVLGSNCVITAYTGKECEVSPYSNDYESVQNVPIVTGCTAWTSPETGDTIILVFNESLWMGDWLEHTLVNPNQVQAHQVDVQDNPFSSAPLCIHSPEDGVQIPLYTRGTIIAADTCTPSQEELETCCQIVLTSPLDWDPHEVCFPQNSSHVEEEEEKRAQISKIQVQVTKQREMGVDVEPGLQGTPYDPASFLTRLISSIRVSSIDQFPNEK